MNKKTVSNKDLRHVKAVDCIPADYHHSRRSIIMTPDEKRFFHQLIKVLKNNYYVFPKVYLPVLFEHETNGQGWHADLQHINRKCVDFVICTKDDLCPVMAIELDNWGHDLKHRKEHDAEVQRIFDYTGLPLKRLDGKAERDDEHLAVILKNLCLKV